MDDSDLADDVVRKRIPEQRDSDHKRSVANGSGSDWRLRLRFAPPIAPYDEVCARYKFYNLLNKTDLKTGGTRTRFVPAECSTKGHCLL